MDIITTHINADFDAFASSIAAKKLYPEALIVFPGSVEKKVRDFIDAYHPVEIKRFRDIPLNKVRRLIVVDTRHAGRIEQLRELLARTDVEVHVYDHHPAGKNDIKGGLEVIENTGAVSTIFTEILQKKRIPLTPLEATALCLGIYEETGSLIFTSTTPRDLTAAAYLLQRGANLNIVSNFLKVELSKEEFGLLNELAQSLREEVVDGVRIKIGRGAIEGFGDIAHIANKVMDMEDIDALFLLIRMADKILIIGRSKVPELNASDVLSEFGGGGHTTAASATIKDMPFELVEEKLISSLKMNIKPLKLAKNVMTTPVVVIQWDSRIREAGAMMTRYGVNVLPVVKKSKYLGILTREVVEKALFHGFGKSDCIDFATTDAMTVSSDTPMSGVETAMIGHNQRFVPVIEGDRITGAITRTDILRSIYDDFLKKNRVASKDSSGGGSTGHSFGKNISGIISERIPPLLLDFLKMAGAAADDLGFAAYIVGGCVRDMFRGEENLDIDIVVENDGIAFAKELGKKLNAKVTVHQRFGTAQVIIKNGLSGKGQEARIDVATARTEYYESPAALPKVETSSIKKDLYRRDFTINTLAVKLNKKDFGLLIDFFGGQRDLKDRIIRVLHNLSFVEDPTRAFRAIRFAERFGFKLTKHTGTLIKTAIRMNIFEKLSGSRIYDELILIFNETNPLKALKALGDYGLLKVIHPSLVFSPDSEALFESVHGSISWFELLFLEEKCDKGMIYIMALLYRLNNAERAVALDRLSVPSRPKAEITSDLLKTVTVLKKIRPDSPVETFHLLNGLPIEVIIFCMALTPDNEKKKAISHFLIELRKVSHMLTGSDLKKMGITPGPVYSEIFSRIIDEKLHMRLASREDEIKFVKKIIGKL